LIYEYGGALQHWPIDKIVGSDLRLLWRLLPVSQPILSVAWSGILIKIQIMAVVGAK
jgi:hypothetical protein